MLRMGDVMLCAMGRGRKTAMQGSTMLCIYLNIASPRETAVQIILLIDQGTYPIIEYILPYTIPVNTAAHIPLSHTYNSCASMHAQPNLRSGCLCKDISIYRDS